MPRQMRPNLPSPPPGRFASVSCESQLPTWVIHGKVGQEATHTITWPDGQLATSEEVEWVRKRASDMLMRAIAKDLINQMERERQAEIRKRISEEKQAEEERLAKITFVYARRGFTSADEPSVADQIASCRTYAEQQGWEIAGVFTDDALSGREPRRPGRFDLMRAAVKRAAGNVIVTTPDRLTSSLDELPRTARILRIFDVSIYAISDESSVDRSL